MARTTDVILKTFERYGYEFFHINIYERIGKGNFHKNILHLGTISFQRNLGTDSWYGMAFITDTTNFESLEKFVKICKPIHKELHFSSQPSEVLELINAKKNFILYNEFFSVSDTGKFFFKVIYNNNHVANMVASDLKEAKRKASAELKRRLRDFDSDLLSFDEYYKIVY